MKRILIHRPGGYDRLVLAEAPDPTPGPGEVVIRTEAIGVNYADCMARMGLYASARELEGYPLCPGFEVAGRVVASNEDVEGWPIGSAVMAVSLFGAYSSHVVVPTSQVRALPSHLTMEQGAAFPAAHLTAWFGLMELAHPRLGETVLVHSAAGGVGSALVQLAVHAGCRVIGVVGAPHKRAIPVSFGAETVIDKSSEDLWERVEALAPGGCEVVLDANGASTLAESYSHLAATGRLVVYGFHSMLPKKGGRPRWLQLARTWLKTPRFDPLAMTRENRSVLAFNLSFLGGRSELIGQGLTWLLGELEAGRLEPPRVTTFPFENVAEAHRALESGQTTGKLVLVLPSNA